MFLAKRLLGGIVTVISNIDPADFKSSDPPPPRRPLNFAESHESEEEKKFRQTFQQLAGDDMEISPEELKKILDNICRKRGLEIGTDGFSIETCRSMVAVMDSDSTGKLGFHEFKFLWGNIKKWQGIFMKYDRDRSGRISSHELAGALAEAGFRLNDPAKKTNDLYSLLVRRYADQDGQMDFDNYVGCLVRLDSMCRAFKTLDKDNNGTINLGIEEWLQLTMYS
ncbi:calpain small subunit 1-like [Periophthalmus magnuspinnatus]|uniref:calpain small subunit 1-like n=1 Tax=Periophthalmus magnuspinnatus TaxID=409849 RepID=UPI00145BCB2A|nr:calpain small subunit 1-like [Periophthalmus magnuspinnatus]